MPHGKPAYTRCVQLSADNRCLIFGHPSRPAVCSTLRPSDEMCGRDNPEAFIRLEALERATRPA